MSHTGYGAFQHDDFNDPDFDVEIFDPATKNAETWTNATKDSETWTNK
ncbi:MAG: hypothetical protein ACM3IH_14125 [Sphingobacteriales bacterium]